jgi:hypothetical protein
MSIASAAIAAIFADPNMAADATWYAGGVGTGTSVHVIKRAPDTVTGFGAARLLSDTMMIDVRVPDIPALAEGDEFDVAGTRYAVQGEPVRDRERLVWTAELVPA